MAVPSLEGEPRVPVRSISLASPGAAALDHGAAAAGTGALLVGAVAQRLKALRRKVAAGHVLLAHEKAELRAADEAFS